LCQPVYAPSRHPFCADDSTSEDTATQIMRLISAQVQNERCTFLISTGGLAMYVLVLLKDVMVIVNNNNNNNNDNK
jgi:glycerate-2-kinase